MNSCTFDILQVLQILPEFNAIKIEETYML